MSSLGYLPIILCSRNCLSSTTWSTIYYCTASLLRMYQTNLFYDYVLSLSADDKLKQRDKEDRESCRCLFIYTSQPGVNCEFVMFTCMYEDGGNDFTFYQIMTRLFLRCFYELLGGLEFLLPLTGQAVFSFQFYFFYDGANSFLKYIINGLVLKSLESHLR